MSVHKKLMHARIMMMKAKLEKTGKNSFAGYKYFELGDFLPAVQLIFEQLGLCGIVSYDNEYASLCITDTDDGTTIRITSPMATAQLKGAHDIQNLGAVESYQRRYLWMTALELTETDPIDSAPPVDIPKKDIPKPIVKSDEQAKKEQKSVKHETVLQDPFAIYIDTQNDTIPPEDYITALIEATHKQLTHAETQDDLKMIFQVNRKHYDKVNELDPRQHVEILGLFKTKKESL